MSLHVLNSSFLTMRPSVKVSDDLQVIIRDNLLIRLVTLCLVMHKVIIDKNSSKIHISTRYFWLFCSRHELNFSEISHIDYHYSSTATSWSMFGTEQDSIEKFTLKLYCYDNRDFDVCNFRGEGAAMTGWGGVFMGDDMLDYQGTQESESQMLLHRLAAIIDVPVGKQYSKEVKQLKVDCPGCGRPTARLAPKCLYCGESLK